MHDVTHSSFSKESGERLGVSLAVLRGKVVVECVKPASLADTALEAGSILLAVNGTRITSPNEAQALIAAASSLELELLRPTTYLLSLDCHDSRGLKLVADREGAVSVAAVPPADGGVDGSVECGSRRLRVGDRLCSVGGRLAESPKSVLKQLSATTGWIEVAVLSSDECGKPRHPNPMDDRAPLRARNAN